MLASRTVSHADFLPVVRVLTPRTSRTSRNACVWHASRASAATTSAFRRTTLPWVAVRGEAQTCEQQTCLRSASLGFEQCMYGVPCSSSAIHSSSSARPVVPRCAVRTARPRLACVRRYVQYVEPRGKLPCASGTYSTRRVGGYAYELWLNVSEYPAREERVNTERDSPTAIGRGPARVHSSLSSLVSITSRPQTFAPASSTST